MDILSIGASIIASTTSQSYRMHSKYVTPLYTSGRSQLCGVDSVEHIWVKKGPPS